MASFPKDLFYDVSQHLTTQDLAAARVTCQTFRVHVSSLVDHVRLNLDSSAGNWNQGLLEAVSAYPNVTQVDLLCSSGTSPQMQSLLEAVTELLSGRLQRLRLETPLNAPLGWGLLGLFSSLSQLASLELIGVSGSAQPYFSDNPLEGLAGLTRLQVTSCWPRVPIPALLCLCSLQDLRFTCDLWNNAELATLSQLTSLSSLHLHGAQMSHQVQHTTLQSLAELPHLQHLHLGTLRPYQAYGVLDSATAVQRLSLAVEGDAAEALRLVHMCRPANTHHLHLTIKGILSDAFWPAVAKLHELRSLELALRSYQRAAAAAQPLPGLPVAHLSSLSQLEVLAVKSFSKGELQQAVPGTAAADLVANCPLLLSLAVDCVDSRDASSLLHSLPMAAGLRKLHLACVSAIAPAGQVAQLVVQGVNLQSPAAGNAIGHAAGNTMGTAAGHAAGNAAGNAVVMAPDIAPDGAHTDLNASSHGLPCAVLSLHNLPLFVEDVAVTSSDALLVHLGMRHGEGTCLPHLHRLHVTDMALDAFTLAGISCCMPALQELTLLQPEWKMKQTQGTEVDFLCLTGPAKLDPLLQLPRLARVHLEQKNAVLTRAVVERLARGWLKSLVLRGSVEEQVEAGDLEGLRHCCRLHLSHLQGAGCAAAVYGDRPAVAAMMPAV